jgi:integrase
MKPLVPHVRKVKWKAHGKRASWLLQGFKDEDGKPVRLFFKSRAEADKEIERRKADHTKFGSLANGLAPEDMVAVARAKELLAPFPGETLLNAARHYADFLKRESSSVTVEKLRDAVLAAKKSDRRGTRYLQDLRSRLGRFVEDFGSRKAATIEAREINDWLRNLELSPVSRNNFRRVLHAMFSEAIAGGHRKDNPVALTAKAKVDPKAPEIFTPAQLRTLLTEADTRIVPALAIGAFAGLRRAEIDRLDWSEIDLAGGLIEVKAEKAKTAARRFVKIQPNLNAWLTPHHRTNGPVRDSEERDLLKAARTAAKIKRWPKNGLRHSFASYHLAHFKDAASLALELGHTSAAVLFAHYRELVRPDAAAAWWQIAPPAEEGNVVDMRGKAVAS